jgi:hypothetical protein
MPEEGATRATFLSYWKGTTLIRVKDKASHCHLERKTTAIAIVSADG